MMEFIDKLIAALREELQQYGEMLARLDEQQQLVIRRAAEAAMQSVPLIQSQSAVLTSVREVRAAATRDLCACLSLSEEASFKDLIPQLPSDYRPLIEALVDENNELLQRIHKRARQNHILLMRTVESMQHVINSLGVQRATPVYNDSGNIFVPSSVRPALYEAVC